MLALAGAFLAVRYGAVPAANALTEFLDGDLDVGPARWIAGFVIAIGAALAIGMLGRGLRRGARAVGLGWADRLGGLALGAAEGILLAGILIFGASWLLGPDHPSISQSRSVALYEQLQTQIRDSESPVRVPLPPGS